METIEISFSLNWNNNLHCRAFTTIRLHNPKKYMKNNRATIKVKAEDFGSCRIVEIKTFKLSQFNEYITFLDTGYSLVKTVEIIKRCIPDAIGINSF